MKIFWWKPPKFSVVFVSWSFFAVFENREKMVLVMEFAAGGELYDYLSERKVLTEEEARRIFRQIATAVYYCHKHKICHRDLKLENILLDEHGNAKVSELSFFLSVICFFVIYISVWYHSVNREWKWLENFLIFDVDFA